MTTTLRDIFEGKSVSLIGAGVSNTPLAEKLAPICSKLTVRDRKTAEELGESAGAFTEAGAELITGPGYLSDLNEDLILRSPGIRPDIPEFLEAGKAGSVVTSEIELFLALHPCRVFAVTGSDGKTTTTTITSKLLAPAGRVLLGGNIGSPLLYRLDSISEDDLLAVELSSFQLMTMDAYFEAAAITNITPNHLNWHTGMDEYIRAKRRILDHSKNSVLNYDNPETRKIAEELQAACRPVILFSLGPIPDSALDSRDGRIWFDGDSVRSAFSGEDERILLSRQDIKLPGLHNIANYMTAIALTRGYSDEDTIRHTAGNFGGVEHRLEFVRELDGVTYINGSIDSSPTRTAAALSAISDRPVVLIAGGYDKNIPYEPLAESIFSSTVRRLVLVGATAAKIEKAVTEHPSYEEKSAQGFGYTVCSTFEDAVLTARKLAVPGDTVILSPASASFDMFRNFEERGRRFKELVNSL